MAFPVQLASSLRRFETQLAGPLEDDVRRNMRVEIISAVAYGVFMATILFVPAVLTRMGGTPALVSIYVSLSYTGHILSSVSLLIMRQVSPKTFAVTGWTLGRAALAVMAFATGTTSLLALAMVLWLLEILPGPAYTRILQSIYPLAHRGKIMALVRFGMALTILVATPLIGLGLDQLGYQAVFPIASALGVASALVFLKMRIVSNPGRASAGYSSLDALRRVMRNRRFLTYQLGVVFFGFGALAANPLYPDVQINRLGLSYTDLGLLGLAQSVSWLIGYFLWGRIIDRYGALRCVMFTFVIQAIAPLSYAFATAGWMLLPAFIAIGLVGAGGDIGFMTACLELSEPEHTQEYAATQSTVIGLRGFIAPFLGVGLLGLGVPQAVVLVCSAGLVLAATLLADRARRM